MTVPVLAIIWHSRTGAARAMAAAIAQGAMSSLEGLDGDPGTHVGLLEACEATEPMLLAASGYVFVCPEYLGGMSGIMKDMFDRNYYPLLGQIEGRPYATVIAAGSDGRGAQAQIDRIVTGWRLRRVADPLVICIDAQTPEAILAPKSVPAEMLERCHALGEAMVQGLALGIF